MTAKKKRIEWIDIMKGFLMFFVIWGHFVSEEHINKWIFSFHMPAYFFLSGITSTFRKDWRLRSVFTSLLYSLLIPYVLLNLIYSPFWIWNMATGGNADHPIWAMIPGILLSNRRTGFPMPSNTTWFLPCLFLTELLFAFIKKVTKEERYFVVAVPLVTAAAYLLGILRWKGAGIWHWQSAFTAVIFMLGGYLFMRNYPKVTEALHGHKARATVMITLLLLLGLLCSQWNGRVSLIGDYYKNLALFYIGAFATTLAFALLFCSMEVNHAEFAVRKHPSRLAHFISDVGRHTLPYLTFHVGWMKLVFHYLPWFDRDNDPSVFVLTVIIFFAFLPVARFIDRIMPSRKKPQPKAAQVHSA